jgi:hypothetical protein
MKPKNKRRLLHGKANWLLKNERKPLDPFGAGIKSW